MTIEQENFAVKLTSATEDHHSWLAVVRFGMGTLIQNQPLLAEILVAEAMKMAAKTPTHNAADEIAGIMRELGVRFVIG
jgi:hypothetical protein